MATVRFSSRLITKSSQEYRQAKIDKEKEELRCLYAKEVPNANIAYVNIADEDGLLAISSIPKRTGSLKWIVHCAFNNTIGQQVRDAIQICNDEAEYKEYIYSLSPTDWPNHDLFFNEFAQVMNGTEQREKQIRKVAKREGKRKGRLEVSRAVIIQIIVYLCISMLGYLKEDFVKRKAAQCVHEHIPNICWEQCGHEMLADLSETEVTNGDVITFEEIDWSKIVGFVGIRNVAKQMGKNLYFYGDITQLKYNTANQKVSLEFVGVRWDGKDHRHRNIPVLLRNSKDSNTNCK